MGTQLLDPIPIWLAPILFAAAALLCYEGGFRVGRWYQRRTPGEQEGPTDLIVGSLLALMAFLLAVTMGMASDRFDARRGLVLAEANAITVAYHQADYLADPATGQLKELLREYVPLRILPADPSQLAANLQRAADLRDQMWAIERAAVQSGQNSDLIASLGDSLTELDTLNQGRVVGALYGRVPEPLVLLLVFGSILSIGMVGYSAGLRERRSVITAVVLVVAMGAVLTLLIDIDRPQEGVINVSQQALIDVEQAIGSPSP